jgi:hypothetical protein
VLKEVGLSKFKESAAGTLDEELKGAIMALVKQQS